MFSDGECESLEDGELPEESSLANRTRRTCSKRKHNSPDNGNRIKMMHVGDSTASSLSSADQNESSPGCLGHVPDSGSQDDSKSLHSEGRVSTSASLAGNCGNGGLIDIEQPDLANSVSSCSPCWDDSSQENAKKDENEDVSLPKTSDDNDTMCVGDDTQPSTSAKVTEFEIIDDISDDDIDGNGYGSEEFDDDDDDSINEEDIDAMLDEGMVEYRKQGPGSADGSKGEEGDDEFAAPVEKEKVVLVEKGVDPFDILPEGWVIVTHNCGMPVYLHKQLRVCTLSKPYFLGPGSARKHDIPLSTIPCMAYRRALVTETSRALEMEASRTVGGPSEREEAANNGTSEDQKNNGKALEEMTAVTIPKVKVESVEEHKKQSCLNPLEVRKYCEKLFRFRTIKVKRFKNWKDRRKYTSLQKKATRPLLPSATKLITCAIPSDQSADKPNKKKEFILNPVGKSDVCILHEYVQHAMRVQPCYIFKELDEAQAPYSATVVINKVEYGTGYASSKKAAKSEAARITLGILIPEIHKVKGEEKKADCHDVSFFDEVKIEDPRISELSAKAGQPGPFQVLYECLKRNYGLGDTEIHMEMKMLKHQKSEFLMRVGKHEAKVICKNKRDGKQQAAQAILQKLHPYVKSWGSLLRLYGTKTLKEKKAEQDFGSLQTKVKLHHPNYKILHKLREEMCKIHSQKEVVKSNVKGKLELGSTDLAYFTDPASLNL